MRCNEHKCLLNAFVLNVVTNSFFNRETARFGGKIFLSRPTNEQILVWIWAGAITYTFRFILISKASNSNRTLYTLSRNVNIHLKELDSETRGCRGMTCNELSCIQTSPNYRPAAFRNLSYGLAGGSLNEQSDSLDAESLRRMRPFLNSGSDRKEDCNTWQVRTAS